MYENAKGSCPIPLAMYAKDESKRNRGCGEE
jgi:hypothetical protein